MKNTVSKEFLHKTNDNTDSSEYIFTRCSYDGFFEIRVADSRNSISIYDSIVNENSLDKLDCLINNLTNLKKQLLFIEKFKTENLKFFNSEKEALDKIQEIESNPSFEIFHGALVIKKTAKRFKIWFK